jgi:hypothetical protein
MKTFFIDLDILSSEIFRELLGFTLTVGLNFRKIDFVKDDKSSRVLVIEVETKAEEKALDEFLKLKDIDKPITVLSDNKATIGTKTIGTFKILGSGALAEAFYLDKTTGKKFVIVR